MPNVYFGSVATVVLALAASALPAAGATETVLYSFPDLCCSYPVGLEFMNGNLFGNGLGYYGYGDNGQIFELSNSNGTWSESSPHMFDGADGSTPRAGVIHDSNGDLFGTTANGDAYGSGNVFELYWNGSSWTDSTIWAFGGTGDGAYPTSDLIMDSSGNLYGTTQEGGTYGGGIAFELTFSGGLWTETILHSFGGGSDGADPFAGLTEDSSGKFYGTTFYGGVHDGGTVFELAQSGGVWNETVLYSFGGRRKDGKNPVAGLIRSSKGVLYGTTIAGGASSVGTVFKLSESSGVWKEKLLHTFTGSDGADPYARLTAVGTKTLYGTAGWGGANKSGTLFKLTNSGGVWSETTVYTFGANGNDGEVPEGAVLLDNSGNLYGTTYYGGADGYGTVWEITP